MGGGSRAEDEGIGKTALSLTNTNAIRDYQKADLPNGGSFAPDHPNGLCDADEDESSQVYVVEAVQIVANPSSQTAA